MNLNVHDKNGPKNMSFPYDMAGAVFDFIVCGAGSSDSVVAARLAEDGNVSVLLAPYARLAASLVRNARRCHPGRQSGRR